MSTEAPEPGEDKPTGLWPACTWCRVLVKPDVGGVKHCTSPTCPWLFCRPCSKTYFNPVSKRQQEPGNE